jgi:hypothetical protein
MEVDAAPYQAEPHEQVLLRADVSVANDIFHGICRVTWVDKVGWDARLWMILPQ